MSYHCLQFFDYLMASFREVRDLLLDSFDDAELNKIIKYAYVFALSVFITVVNSIRQSPLCHEQIYERKNT